MHHDYSAPSGEHTHADCRAAPSASHAYCILYTLCVAQRFFEVVPAGIEIAVVWLVHSPLLSAAQRLVSLLNAQ